MDQLANSIYNLFTFLFNDMCISRQRRYSIKAKRYELQIEEKLDNLAAINHNENGVEIKVSHYIKENVF